MAIALLLVLVVLPAGEHAVLAFIDHAGADRSRIVALEPGVAIDGELTAAKQAAEAAYREALAAYNALDAKTRKGQRKPTRPELRVLKPYARDRTAADSQLVAFLKSKGLLDPARWRPFDDKSPWNTPLADNAAIDPLSKHYIDQLAGSCPRWPFLTVGGTVVADGKRAWSVPCYFVDSSTTPMRQVPLYGMKLISPEIASGGAPIPDGAYPEVGTADAHMVVVDIRRNLSWEFYHLRNGKNQQTYDRSPWDWSPGSFVCEGAYLIPTGGSGILPPWGTVKPWMLSESSRASGFPLIAGLIRAEHVAAGRIPHAIVLLYPRCRADWFISPASRAQGKAGSSDGLVWTRPEEGLPCGARVRIRADVDLDRFKVPPAAKVILRAMQEFGAFIADGSGAISTTLDDTPVARAYWEANGIGVMTFTEAFNAAVMRETMEVVAMPDLWWKGYTGKEERRPDR